MTEHNLESSVDIFFNMIGVNPKDYPFVGMDKFNNYEKSKSLYIKEEDYNCTDVDERVVMWQPTFTTIIQNIYRKAILETYDLYEVYAAEKVNPFIKKEIRKRFYFLEDLSDKNALYTCFKYTIQTIINFIKPKDGTLLDLFEEGSRIAGDLRTLDVVMSHFTQFISGELKEEQTEACKAILEAIRAENKTQENIRQDLDISLCYQHKMYDVHTDRQTNNSDIDFKSVYVDDDVVYYVRRCRESLSELYRLKDEVTKRLRRFVASDLAMANSCLALFSLIDYYKEELTPSLRSLEVYNSLIKILSHQLSIMKEIETAVVKD